MLNRLRRLLGGRPHETCPECGASDQRSYCDVCGYDLVNKTRSKRRPPPST